MLNIKERGSHLDKPIFLKPWHDGKADAERERVLERDRYSRALSCFWLVAVDNIGESDCWYGAKWNIQYGPAHDRYN
jgi:hypothetical protein